MHQHILRSTNSFDTYKSTNPEIEGNVLKTYNNMQSQ